MWNCWVNWDQRTEFIKIHLLSSLHIFQSSNLLISVIIIIITIIIIIIIIIITIHILLTYGCGTGGSMRACHAAGKGSIPGRDKFPGWGFFSGFFLTVRQISGSFRPTRFPEYHLDIIIILLISALLEWMCEWMVCIIFNVRVASEVAPALSWSLIRGGPQCPCVVKKYVLYVI